MEHRLEDAAVILNAVKAGKGAYGYNAGTGAYGDMIESGILDRRSSRAWRCRTRRRLRVCCSRRKS
jgi:hypothetical protein